MKLQQFLSQLRKALDTYQMIQEGDKIAVGLSGGKDSMALLYALNEIKRFYPQKFELMAVTVDLGFGNFDLQEAKEFCAQLKIPYYVVETQIAEIVFDVRKESNPCSLCSKLRKGAINQFLLEHNICKLAYAHHKDDFIETLMMSLLFEGRFQSFLPKTYLERTQITLIRPMIFLWEADVKGFCNKYHIPVTKSPCPADGTTKREYVKDLIRQLNREHPGVKERLFASLQKNFHD